jgi:hypothetical protein
MAPNTNSTVHFEPSPFLGQVQELDVVENPHKGWYWHFYDNGTVRYREEEGDWVNDFPGLRTLYIRLPWCEVEPSEGVFNWDRIDQIAEANVPLGRSLAFSITCKETDPPYTYATPEWVRQAGAKGNDLQGTLIHEWEPDYGDEIFLSKLRALHEAFAARYDHQPWIEWIDVGSYGDWGEGHTTASSKREWPVSDILRHFEIYRDCYQKSPLQANDDFVGSRLDLEGAKAIRRYLDEAGFAITDHGVCVDFFARAYGFNTLRNPEWLLQSALRKPLVLELEHYETAVELGHWKKGAPLLAAIEDTRCSFAGFHGYPRKWLQENPDFARSTANRLGYWLFPLAASLESPLKAGADNVLKLEIRNHGVAPLYYPASLWLRISPEDGSPPLEVRTTGAQVEQWLGDTTVTEEVRFSLPEGYQPKSCRIEIRLVDQKTSQPIAFCPAQGLPGRWFPLGRLVC